METVGFILLTDVKGTKFDTTAKSALKWYFTGGTPQSPVNVLRGELLEMKQERPCFNYMLSRDPNICLPCDGTDVAPLNSEEFLLLEAIGAPYDRLDTFKNKLEWGVHLKTGEAVNITIPGYNLSVVERARATIHYKGPIGKVPGINFGVEILQMSRRTHAAAIGTTDGTFQGKRYFTCDSKCGFFAPLHTMSPTSDVSAQVDAADLSKGQTGKHDYSGTTRRDNSGASSQTPSQNPHAVSEGSKGLPQHVHTRPDLVKESSIDRPSKFRLGQHVAFYDNEQGAKHYGIVRWTGESRKLPYLIVGIQTDKDVYITDFENSIVGMSYLIPRIPNRRRLFLPETLVDKVDSVAPLHMMSPTSDVSAQVDTADLSKGQTDKHDYSGATRRDNSGASSRTPPQNPSYCRAVSEGSKGPSQHVQPRPDLVKESSVDQPSKFRLGQRVAFYDRKQGAKHFGVVRWTGRESRRGKLPYIAVGIQTDKDELITDFENSILGMSYLIPSVSTKRALFLPETQIDEVRSGSPQHQAAHSKAVQPQRETVKSLAKQFNTSPKQVREQKKADKAVIDALAADLSVSISEQEEIYRRLQAENEAKKLNEVMEFEGCSDGTYPNTNRKFFTCPHGKLRKGLESLQHAADKTIEKSSWRHDKDLLEENRRLSLLHSEAAAQIQGFKKQLQKQEQTIQAQKSEITAKNLDIQKKNKQIADLQWKVEIYDNEQMQLSAGNLQSWNIPRAEIQSIAKHEIGSGAWGVVYSGTFRGEHVAIKQAHEDVLHTTTIDMLKREVMIMAHIQHPNLVRFIAAVLDDAVERGTDMPIIVSELMDINLRTAYRKYNLSSSLISIFCDVAYALHYLHQHRQPIIHRDVSAPNVLLRTLRNGAYQAKVSDFGSANLVKQASTTAAGAIVYSAPEMFPNEDITVPPEPQTTKVDVFSYGILLLEVIVKELPTRETRHTMLQRVNQQWKQMHELIVHCTKPRPSDRPTMADILNKLNRLPH